MNLKFTYGASRVDLFLQKDRVEQYFPTMMKLPIYPLLLMAVLLLPSTVLAKDSISPEERAKIEFLITSVEKQRETEFIRNGKAYKANIAGRFLRGKWKAKTKDICTAEEFIEKVATISSTTGKPYLIRFSDGKEMESAEYLRGLLKDHNRSR